MWAQEWRQELSALWAAPCVTPLRWIFLFPECFIILTLASPSPLGPSAGLLGAHMLLGLGAEDGGICLHCAVLLPAATKLPVLPLSWASILWWALREACIKYHDTVPSFGALQTLFFKALISTGSSLELVLSLFFIKYHVLYIANTAYCFPLHPKKIKHHTNLCSLSVTIHSHFQVLSIGSAFRLLCRNSY